MSRLITPLPICLYKIGWIQDLWKEVLGQFTEAEDTGYPHDGRADKDSYPHDGPADKNSYPHDGRADKDSYLHDRHNQYIISSL